MKYAYAKVVPAVRLPRGFMEPYDYRIPESLSGHVVRGSVVLVPWRNKVVDGIVYSVSNRSDVKSEKLKDVHGLGSVYPLPEDVLQAAEWAARYYISSLGTVVRNLLPKTPKRKIIIEPPQDAGAPEPVQERPLNATQRLIRYVSPADKWRQSAKIMSGHVGDGRSCLVIVPHLEELDVTCTELGKLMPQCEILSLHGKLSATRTWGTWQTMLSGKPVVVVGTRMAAFAPLPDPGAILIHECDSRDLKQYDQNPRFDARAVAKERARRGGFDVFFMSHAPRVEEYRAARNRELVMEEHAMPSAETTLVDISGKSYDIETAVLPPATLNAADSALRSKKRVLIFHNRLGTATVLICRDCRKVYRCGTCGVTMSVHGKSLHCHRCGTEVSVPALCDACRSASLCAVGIGTRRLEEIMRERFPFSSVARFDAETRQEDGEALLKADILIGTQLLLHRLSETEPELPEIGLVVGTDMDGLLAHPGFRVTESAWRTVTRLRDLAASSGAKLFLHTYDADDPRIRSILRGFGDFSENELGERKKLMYPPHSRLVTITSFGENEGQAAGSSEKIKEDIASKFGGKADLWMHGPLRPAAPFRHGRWRNMVVLKTMNFTDELSEFLMSLDDELAVDVDPENIS